MKTVVVYESFWGNTAAIAKAVAAGLGPEVRALTTGQATLEVVAGADLIVAGAPVLGFSLTTDQMRENIRSTPAKGPTPPDLSNPSLRSWLAALPKGSGHCAAFETRLWWSLGGATSTILKSLAASGYQPVGKGGRFIVTGGYGPLKEGELERARKWGAELARAVG